VLYRDVGHGVAFALQLWFLASPVAYPSSLVSQRWSLVYALNPIVGLIDAARATVLGTSLRPATLAVSCLSTLVLLIGGIVIFQRLERRFADVI
jgi:ABC-type polysaccharide/polyol phosphate export permease